LARQVAIRCVHCGRRLGGDETYRKHRVIAGDQRRCLTDQQMRGRGWYRDRDYVWHRPTGASAKGSAQVRPSSEPVSLFDAVDDQLQALGLVEPRTKVRSTDPDTSHKAAYANRVHRGNQRGQILLAHLEGPMTDDECHLRLSHIRLNSLTTRRSELVGLGLLKDSGERRRTSSGSEAVVWSMTEEGATCVREMAVSA
jgi:hypothetical protein